MKMPVVSCPPMETLQGLPGSVGGVRIGAGRPKNGSPEQMQKANERAKEAAAKAGLDGHDPFGDIAPDVLKNNQVRANYNESKAASEAIKAKHAELIYRVKLGEYVERGSVRNACSMAMSSFAQAMRSMQDDMERKLSLDPVVVEAIGEYVDRTLDQLASEFMLLTGAEE